MAEWGAANKLFPWTPIDTGMSYLTTFYPELPVGQSVIQ